VWQSKIVLIAETPGTGKPMLMEHIAFSWAKGETLLKFQLVHVLLV